MCQRGKRRCFRGRWFVWGLVREARILRWQELTVMGVVQKWAWPFITFPGHRPEPAKQLRLDSLLNQERKTRTDGGTEHLTKNRAEVKRQTKASILADPGEPFGTQATLTPTPCGIRSNCDGCALYNTPGHPGSSKGLVRYIPYGNSQKTKQPA